MWLLPDPLKRSALENPQNLTCIFSTAYRLFRPETGCRLRPTQKRPTEAANRTSERAFFMAKQLALPAVPPEWRRSYGTKVYHVGMELVMQLTGGLLLCRLPDSPVTNTLGLSCLLPVHQNWRTCCTFWRGGGGGFEGFLGPGGGKPSERNELEHRVSGRAYGLAMVVVKTWGTV